MRERTGVKAVTVAVVRKRRLSWVDRLRNLIARVRLALGLSAVLYEESKLK